MAWRTPPGTGCPQAESLCSDITPMLAIGLASSGGSQIPIREADAKTPMRKPHADPASWRSIRRPDADPSSGVYSGSTLLMAWRTSPGTGRPQAESLCSDIDSDAGHRPVVLWRDQTPIRESDAKTPMRKPDADPSSWRLRQPTPLMAWRPPPGTGCPQAESLCSDIDSDAGH